MTDFGELLHGLVPGIYRQKDERGELRRFLAIMASPLAELEESIGQLHEDTFAAGARGPFLPLIGALIGVELDPTLPPALQRASLEEAFAFYRRKGLAEPLARSVEARTGWRALAVDFSQVVARLPYLETLRPLLRRRDRPVGEDPPGSGRFTFSPTAAALPLHDDRLGRVIRREEIESRAAEILGADDGLAIRERGVHLVGPGAPAPLRALAADLGDFANPLTPGGAPLSLAAGEVAIDPELGRFLMAAPLPLAGNLRVDFHELVPAAIAPQTFDIRDSGRMERLGRSDDPAPYTLDLRRPRDAAAEIGRAHFDNHGFFLTLGRTVANQRPNLVHSGARAGFTFDGRLLPAGHPGHALQLLDGLDGSPLTRRRLAGAEAAFFNTWRGFTIHALGPPAVIVAADLADLDDPRDVVGAALALAPTDVAVDPQLGRFLIDLAALALTADELRVGYLLGPVRRLAGATPLRLGPTSDVFAFLPDGATAALRDGFDGTPIAVKLRLGAALADFHGGPRGFVVRLDGNDLTQVLAPETRDLGDPAASASAGRLAVDLDRGRFALPAGLLGAGGTLEVDVSVEDVAAEARVIASLEQRLPRMVPAGVVPVVIDSRTHAVDPRTLL